MAGPVPVSGWPSRPPRPIPWSRWWAAIGISVVVFVVLAVGSASLVTGAVLGLLGWLLMAYMGVLG